MLALSQKLKDPRELLKDLKNLPEKHWLMEGESQVFKLFGEMSRRVPAYKDFLQKNGVDPLKIKTFEDLKKVPTISKENYLKKYPTEQLCWDGEFNSKQWTFSVTSGSTGTPFYFPRQEDQDLQYALSAELYLLNNFRIDERSTLYINGFAMGAWIGGLFTFSAIHAVAQNGKYPMSIITPGVNKPEILKALKELGGKFDQVIIGGYPPFIKDLIDEGVEQGVEWQNYRLGFIFSAEGFSEQFRDYIMKKTGLKNIYTDTLNHYGTVDLGTMAHETPLSILLRRISVNNDKAYGELFGQASKLPTLAQFLPELFFFEEEEGQLICSAFSGFPVVRYDLKDHGGVFTFEDIRQRCMQQGINIDQEIQKAGIQDQIWNLPFVYIYERSDLSVSLYGGNIYPETIRKAIQIEEFESQLTGKFTMLINHDREQNPHLEINAELKPKNNDDESLKKNLKTAIVEKLLKENSEYKVLFDHFHEKILPEVKLWPYGHESYFKEGGKQKWVSK